MIDSWVGVSLVGMYSNYSDAMLSFCSYKMYFIFKNK